VLILLSQMFVSQLGTLPAPRCPHQIAFLNKKRFVHFFNGSFILPYGCGNGFYTYGAAFEFIDDGQQDSVIHFIKAMFIHIECMECILCNGRINFPISLNLRKIAGTSKQSVCNTGCAPAPPGNLVCRLLLEEKTENTCRT